MCYQLQAGAITHLYGSNFSTNYFTTTTKAMYSVAATKLPVPGTYLVGRCVRSNGSSPSTTTTTSTDGSW